MSIHQKIDPSYAALVDAAVKKDLERSTAKSKLIVFINSHPAEAIRLFSNPEEWLGWAVDAEGFVYKYGRKEDRDHTKLADVYDEYCTVKKEIENAYEH